MRCFLFFSVLIFFSVSLQAQTAQSVLDDWAEDAYLKHASVGVSILNVSTQEVVAAYEPERSLIPASNLKVLTTISALAILGADYRFETTITYDGHIDHAGVLHGNVYIKGGGDPSLGSSQIQGAEAMSQVIGQFRQAVEQAGIKEIKGRVIGDDRVFTSAVVGTNWQWLDLGNYYACGAFGLNINENLYLLHFQQQKQLGQTPKLIGTSPYIPGLRFHNEIKSAAANSGDQAYIYGAPYAYQRHLRGTLPIGNGRFTIKGAMPNPPLFVAQRLDQALEEAGIVVQRPPASIRNLEKAYWPSHQALKEIFSYQSPTLAAIVKRTNMKSVNLYAECLIRAIGAQVKGDASVGAGLAAIEAYWQTKGLRFDGVQLYDGSGMSPRNVVPTAFLAKLMALAYNDTEIRSDLLQSLPLAGRSGGLKNRLKGTAAEAKLYAKSGSLEQVRGYTGLLKNTKGEWLSFSVMLNNFDGSGAQATKKIMQLLAKMPAFN